MGIKKMNLGSPNSVSNKVYKTRMLYHGSNMVVKYPEIRTPKVPRDFGKGFYVTRIETQAIEQAYYKYNKMGGYPTLNIYKCPKNLDRFGFKYLYLGSDEEEWLKFISVCRSSDPDYSCGYDIVEGPMMDDKAWIFAQSFLNKTYDYNRYKRLAKYRKETHQIAFCSKSALKLLEFYNAESNI